MSLTRWPDARLFPEDADAVRRLARLMTTTTTNAMAHVIRLGAEQLAARVSTGCTIEDMDQEAAARTRALEVTT